MGYLASKRRENKSYIESVLDFCQIQVNQSSGNLGWGGGQNATMIILLICFFSLLFKGEREKNLTLSDLSKLYQPDSEVNMEATKANETLFLIWHYVTYQSQQLR